MDTVVRPKSRVAFDEGAFHVTETRLGWPDESRPSAATDIGPVVAANRST